MPAARWLPRLLGVGTALLAAVTAAGHAQSVPKRALVKATYILRFIEFTRWPEAALASADGPFRLCVLGERALAGALEQTVAGESAHGRVMRVRRFPKDRPLGELTDCQVVFLGADGADHRRAGGLAALANRPVLTIGDGEHYAREGALLALAPAGNRIVFFVNRSAVLGSPLRLSSKLLRLGRMVAGSGE